MANQSFVLRCAVNGKTREELADNLSFLAEYFRARKDKNPNLYPLNEDNEGGGMPIGDVGYFDYDFSVSPQGKDEVVSVLFPEPADITLDEYKQAVRDMIEID